MASFTCSLSERPVAMMNGMLAVLGCLRITRSSVSPSMSSMFQSEMIRRTLDFSSLPSAARPDLASMMSLKPSCVRMYLQIPRIDCWSSTLSTLRSLALGITHYLYGRRMERWHLGEAREKPLPFHQAGGLVYAADFNRMRAFASLPALASIG